MVTASSPFVIDRRLPGSLEPNVFDTSDYLDLGLIFSAVSTPEWATKPNIQQLSDITRVQTMRNFADCQGCCFKSQPQFE